MGCSKTVEKLINHLLTSGRVPIQKQSELRELLSKVDAIHEGDKLNKEFVGMFNSLLKNKSNEQERYYTLLTLGQVNSRESASMLSQVILTDTNPVNRRNSLISLSRMGKNGEMALESIYNNNPDRGYEVVYSICEYGEVTKELSPTGQRILMGAIMTGDQKSQDHAIRFMSDVATPPLKEFDQMISRPETLPIMRSSKRETELKQKLCKALGHIHARTLSVQMSESFPSNKARLNNAEVMIASRALLERYSKSDDQDLRGVATAVLNKLPAMTPRVRSLTGTITQENAFDSLGIA